MRPPAEYVWLLNHLSERLPRTALIERLGPNQKRNILRNFETFARELPWMMRCDLGRSLLRESPKPKPFRTLPPVDPSLVAAVETECSTAGLVGKDFQAAKERLIAVRLWSVNPPTNYTGASRATLDRWMFRYQASGAAGLVPGKSTGRPRKTDRV
jgi:hypothetical protein